MDGPTIVVDNRLRRKPKLCRALFKGDDSFEVSAQPKEDNS